MSRRGLVLFVSLGLIWGLPYLLIKVAVEYVDPSFVVFVRVLLGAAVLLPIVLARGQWALLRGHWRWVVAFALVEITFTFLALTWAEQRISSSLAALLIAAVPIVGAILAAIIITAVNLIGGLLIGVIQRGQPVGDAVNTMNSTATAVPRSRAASASRPRVSTRRTGSASSTVAMT